MRNKSIDKKRQTKRKKTLKKRIHNYISRKRDICCEEDIDRKVVIQQIVEKYKEICKIYNQVFNEEQEYLDRLVDDLIKFIGYRNFLEKDKDFQGVALWNYLHKRAHMNKKLNEKNIEKILYDVPLYFLLSLSGYASYSGLLTSQLLT